jgi:hypothetical protein
MDITAGPDIQEALFERTGRGVRGARACCTSVTTGSCTRGGTGIRNACLSRPFAHGF